MFVRLCSCLFKVLHVCSFLYFCLMFVDDVCWFSVTLNSQRLLCVFWFPSSESTWTYLDFEVAEELSDFSSIACGMYMVRCCSRNATTYQMRSLEPCIADGFATAKKAAHVSLQWLIHENPNPCRAHPALGLQMSNLLLCLRHIMAYLVLKTRFKCLEVPIHQISSGN